MLEEEKTYNYVLQMFHFFCLTKVSVVLGFLRFMAQETVVLCFGRSGKVFYISSSHLSLHLEFCDLIFLLLNTDEKRIA